MSEKMHLPDEFLDAISGGIMVVDGKDVTDYTVNVEGGVTTITLMTDAGNYGLSLDSGSFKDKLVQGYAKEAHADPKDRYLMDTFGFKPVA